MSPPQRARVAVTAIFALNGALFASIFSRLPAIQERVEIGDGALGLALLCAMLGLLGSQLFAGPLIALLGAGHCASDATHCFIVPTEMPCFMCPLPRPAAAMICSAEHPPVASSV